MSQSSMTLDIENAKLLDEACIEKASTLERYKRYCQQLLSEARYAVQPIERCIHKIPRAFGIRLSILLALGFCLIVAFRRIPFRQDALVFNPHTLSVNATTHTAEMGRLAEKPQGLKIVGFVFYSQRRHAEVLECYLRRNLVRYGGWLDEVRFLANTDDLTDINWMKHLASEMPEYVYIKIHHNEPWLKVWHDQAERGVVHVKVDDDIVFVDDNAIPEMVSSLLRRPEAFTVTGNIINSGCNGWLYNHLEAMYSYLPEHQKPTGKNPAAYGPSAWRASELPTYNHTGNLKPFFEGPRQDPPYDNHRWLPLRDDSKKLPLTPAWNDEFREPSPFNYLHWQAGAQEHHSFLQNLEDGKLSRYHFGQADGLWNLRQMRGNLNFIAVRGDDILNTGLPKDSNAWTDDEIWFTVLAPQQTNRQAYIQSKAIVSHFSFMPQHNGMHTTDLLGRYRAYANEMICPADRQIPIREHWPGFDHVENYDNE